MRDKSISIAKGISIALVVMAHSICIDFIIRCILIFALSLFFFVSGYCFKDKYLDDALAFVKKRFTGIYWPYLKWSLLFLLMHNVFYHLNIYSDEYGYWGKTSVLYTTADFVKRAISVTTQMQGSSCPRSRMGTWGGGKWGGRKSSRSRLGSQSGESCRSDRKTGGPDWSVCPTGLEGQVSNIGSHLHIFGD